MKVGFSIQDPAFKKDNYQLLANHDRFETFVAALKSKGVNSIEIRKLSREIDNDTYDAYNKSIQKIWDAGLEITIHGDLTGHLTGSKFVEVYPSMGYILDHFHKYQDKLVMTLHAMQEKRENSKSSSEQLKIQTIAMLHEWTQMVESENLPVYFALENNRSKEKAIDPGNSCKVVVEMVECVNHPNLGICWDMGHLYSNLLAGVELDLVLDDLPPKAFLEKVYHTHIHALNLTGKTHFPLTDEYELPIELYAEALRSHGYDGVYNIELSFDRYEQDMPVAKKVYSSILRLKNL